MFVKFLSLLLERKEDAKCSRKFDEFMSLHMRYPAVWEKKCLFKVICVRYVKAKRTTFASYASSLTMRRQCSVSIHMRSLKDYITKFECMYIIHIHMRPCFSAREKMLTIIHFVVQASTMHMCFVIMV